MGSRNRNRNKPQPAATDSDAAEQFVGDKPKAAAKKPVSDQKIRDAHYFEDGVKADGTGGKAPKEV